MIAITSALLNEFITSKSFGILAAQVKRSFAVRYCLPEQVCGFRPYSQSVPCLGQKVFLYSLNAPAIGAGSYQGLS